MEDKAMKKNYLQPTMQVVKFDSLPVLSPVSNATTSGLGDKNLIYDKKRRRPRRRLVNKISIYDTKTIYAINCSDDICHDVGAEHL